MTAPQPGDRVLYWPGGRDVRIPGKEAIALSGVIPAADNNFGTDVVRIQRCDTGGTDYIATTHLMLVIA